MGHVEKSPRKDTKMETNVNYTLVGAFVLVLTAFICLGVIWLARGFSVESYKTYVVYMEESVTGLSNDAPIEFNGVAVGTVSDIKISHRNPRLVELLLSVKDGTPITQGTVATLGSHGVTGISFVALKDDGSDLAPLLKQPGQPYPVIKTSPSLFARLDTGLEKINTSLYKISSAVEYILDSQTQAAIKNTISNLNRVSSTLAAQTDTFTQILNNTARASQNLPQMVQSSQGAIRTFSTQTVPAVDRAMRNLDTVSQNLLQITNEVKQNPAMIIRGKAPAALGPGEK